MVTAECRGRNEESLFGVARASRFDSRVLVVEDDEAMRSYVTEMLEEEGFRVSGEPDTLSGLIRLLAEGADVLILDWKMPDLDGLELLGTVGRCFPEIPVIFVSAFATPELYSRAMEKGAFSFLTKPFRRADLLAEIDGALQFIALRGEGGMPGPRT